MVIKFTATKLLFNGNSVASTEGNRKDIAKLVKIKLGLVD